MQKIYIFSLLSLLIAACTPPESNKNGVSVEASSETAPIVIKGLSINMSIDDAVIVVNERFSQVLGGKLVVGDLGDVIKEGEWKVSTPKGFALNFSRTANSDSNAGGFQMAARSLVVQGIPGSFQILADEEKLVYQIVLPGKLASSIFNAADMQPSDFCQEIVNNYNIPTMQPFSKKIDGEFLSGWEYSSPEGVRIRVFQDKSIEMLRIPKKTARSFD